MANSLLDFVMSLVRDPDAAAQYAANPAQAIADAHLTDVTSVDVDHLIPVVAESMSTVVPSGGFAGGADTLLDSAHNVWASGAATAAFDAFDDHLPLQGNDVIADHVPTVANVIELPEDSSPTIVDPGFDDAERACHRGSDGLRRGDECSGCRRRARARRHAGGRGRRRRTPRARRSPGPSTGAGFRHLHVTQQPTIRDSAASNGRAVVVRGHVFMQVSGVDPGDPEVSPNPLTDAPG